MLLRLRHLHTLRRNIFSKKRVDQELDEEIQAYLELVSADKVRCGMAPEEACRQARMDLGASNTSRKMFAISDLESQWTR
jgi:macrolide transport system ATP-binding/permease protein